MMCSDHLLECMRVAIEKNDIEAATVLLAQDASLMHTSIPGSKTFWPEDQTFWRLAIETDDVSMVKLFIENGVDLDQKNMFGQTALFWAKSVDVLDLLLGSGADLSIRSEQGLAPISWAHGTDQVQWFLEHDEDLHSESCVSLIRNSLESGTQLPVVKLLLSTGIEAEAFDDVLYWAAFWHNIPAATMLIKAGADIEAKKDLEDYPFDGGWLTIMKDKGVLEGWTPLHCAALQGAGGSSVKMVSFLLSKGANPDARTGNGMTPLDLVVKNPGLMRDSTRHELVGLLYCALLRWYDT